MADTKDPGPDVSSPDAIAARVRELLAYHDRAMKAYTSADAGDESAFANALEKLRIVQAMLHATLLTYFEVSERERKKRRP